MRTVALGVAACAAPMMAAGVRAKPPRWVRADPPMRIAQQVCSNLSLVRGKPSWLPAMVPMRFRSTGRSL